MPPERCPGFSIHLGPFSEGSSKVVVTEAQCHGASSTPPTQVCNIHLHGCLSSGLGSSLCSHDCPRSLVDSAVQTAHQCSGPQSCAPGSQDFCTSVIPSSKDYSGSLRQHSCLYLHKQTRGHSFLGTVCPDLASVCLLSQEQVVLTARHVPGVMNLVADQLSRSQQTLHTEWSLNPRSSGGCHK